MLDYISWEDSLKLNNPIYVDVRSPLEFEVDHVPNAINIPIFTNDERHDVGLLYKEQGNKIASELGLSIVAPKLPDIVKSIRALTDHHEVVLYCFRGGMRSRSIATIVSLMGIKIKVMEGGYKRYRSYINDFFTNEISNLNVILLKGLTGVGKTDLLKELDALNLGILDLEGLANNRGSVYGSVGLGCQPTQKYFESQLWYKLYNNRDKMYVFIECEGKRVGGLRVPDPLFHCMEQGIDFLVYDSVDNRVKRIVAEYTNNISKEDLIVATGRLKKLLGSQKVNLCVDYINDNNYSMAVRDILLPYYDSYYKYPTTASDEYKVSIDNSNPHKAALFVSKYLSSM